MSILNHLEELAGISERLASSTSATPQEALRRAGFIYIEPNLYRFCLTLGKIQAVLKGETIEMTYSREEYTQIFSASSVEGAALWLANLVPFRAEELRTSLTTEKQEHWKEIINTVQRSEDFYSRFPPSTR